MNNQPAEKILIIIPAYNEAANLPHVVKSVREHLPSSDILVVNDCSTDDTPAVTEKLDVPTINLAVNLGIGGAVQTGIQYAQRNRYDFAVQVDADGQHDPSQIPRLLEPVREGRCGLSVGSRFLGPADVNTPFFRKIGIKLFSILTSLYMRKKITDSTSGFRAMNRNVISFFARNYPVDFPDSEALILLARSGFAIEEVPVTILPRREGKSTTGFVRSLYYPFRMILPFISILVHIRIFKKRR